MKHKRRNTQYRQRRFKPVHTADNQRRARGYFRDNQRFHPSPGRNYFRDKTAGMAEQ